MEKRERPPKAYKNLDFLTSREGRSLRILAEFDEPQSRFRKLGIKHSIVFFGSARSASLETVQAGMDEWKISKQKEGLSSEQVEILAEKRLRLAKYYNDAVELSRRLTEWSINRETGKQTHFICSGGGPGMMEAANRGAELAGGKSIGLNISLPMEQYPNSYITEELMFEFHYFFMRKFWFVYLAKALVIFPGGFGTLDELMEVVTLIQTKKIRKPLPIIIFGTEYWNDVINVEAMVKWGTISKEDLKLFHATDSIDEAYDYLTSHIQLRK